MIQPRPQQIEARDQFAINSQPPVETVQSPDKNTAVGLVVLQGQHLLHDLQISLHQSRQLVTEPVPSSGLHMARGGLVECVVVTRGGETQLVASFIHPLKRIHDDHILDVHITIDIAALLLEDVQ